MALRSSEADHRRNRNRHIALPMTSTPKVEKFVLRTGHLDPVAR